MGGPRTDFRRIVTDQLVRLDPSPIIALNRAIAVAELDGPEVALAAVDRLEDTLAGSHAYHATRAELLRACLASLDRTVDWAHVRLVVVDDGSSEPAAVELLTSLEARPGTRVLAR